MDQVLLQWHEGLPDQATVVRALDKVRWRYFNADCKFEPNQEDGPAQLEEMAETVWGLIGLARELNRMRIATTEQGK